MELDPNIRVLSRSQARGLGMTDRAVERKLGSGHWRRLLPSVYLAFRGRPTSHDLCRAALLFAGADASLSGTAATNLHGITTSGRPPILVLANQSRRHIRTDWLQLRPTARLPTPAWKNGLAIAPAARAVADHALAQAGIDDVRAVVARSVQRGHCSVEQLERELRQGPMRGSAFLRQAIAEISTGSRSAPEARAARALTRAGLGGFGQNVAVGPYFADFLWRGLRAILEIDSVEYHFDAADWARTLARHRELESMAYSVIHVPPSEVYDEPRFVANVGRWLESRRKLA